MPLLASKKVQPAAETHENWQVTHGLAHYYGNFTLHVHDGYEFFLHARGGGLYQLGQQVFPLQAYHLVAVRPRQPHGLVSSRPLQDFERLVVQVSADVLEQMRFEGTSVKDIVDRCCEQSAAQVFLSPQSYLQLQTLAAAIRPSDDALSPLERMEAHGYLSVLISRFCQALTHARRMERSLTQDSLMQDVYNHILERFAEDCSLDALAERFSISKFHLSHRFSQTYGMSLHQFVLRCRVAYAQLLIRQGEPMMSVYYQCGFNDYSSFVRAFSRIAGVSPRAWRKQQLAASGAASQPTPPFFA